MQNFEFTRQLGDAVKRSRGKTGFTQNEVAAKMGIDVRTLLNIENYRGNPKMHVLYPLIRTLKIDPNEIFYPELQCENSAIRQLQLLLTNCTEEEADALIPICETILSVLRSRNATLIE